MSHDRWFVNELATRVLEIRPDGIDDFKGSYADFLRQSETDHLDAEEVIRQARGKKR